MDKPNHMKLRTTIMVASMIALPMAAVLGLKWPHFEAAEQATAQAHDHDHRHGHPHPTEQGGTATPPAPAWGASATTNHASPLAASNSANPVGSSSFGTPGMPQHDHAVIPAVDKNDSSIADYPVERATNNDVHASHAFGGPNGQVIPVGHESSIRPLPQPNETGTEPSSGFATTASATPAPVGGDPFLQIQQRLRALGALHYSLETWGSQGEAYRFQCRMAAGHSPNYSRHFEATDVDPLRVMQTVLVEIESWKSGRLP
jgi:hypothetical protein